MVFWIIVSLLGFFSLSWLYGTYSRPEFGTIGNRDIAWSWLLLFGWVALNREALNPLHALWLAPIVMVVAGFLMISGISRAIYPIGRFIQLGGLALALVLLSR
jgi:hypothetical protein